MSKLQCKIAIVTGANSGIGLATAKMFISEGAQRVYITGRREVELNKAIVSLGSSAIGVQGDVTNPADLDRLYARVKEEVGRVDVVFANTGFAAPAPLGSLTNEHIDSLLNTNIAGIR